MELALDYTIYCLYLEWNSPGDKIAIEFIHTPAYSPDFNLAEYEIHLLRLQKLHHLPSNITIAEIENTLEEVKILMTSEQILKTLDHIFALAPLSIPWVGREYTTLESLSSITLL